MKTLNHDSDDILKRLFDPKPITVQESLEELFLQRIESLKITKTTAGNIMEISSRSLEGILSGEQKMIDYTQLIKLSNFLGIQLDQVVKLYLEKLQEIHPVKSEIRRSGEVVNFLNENFNLAELRKVGLIKSLTDYDEITSSICKYFGLRSIFDYREPDMNIAFSAGKRAKTNCSIKNWIFLAEQTCIELRNPNDYNRDKLIEYFSEIRWHSMNVENGLVNVIKHLYQLGITVVFIPSFPSLHVRGATFSVNDKPCIAITDYVGFYPTFWFSLIHELYHVLFDWEEILLSEYHVSLDDLDSFGKESLKEKEADNFAREYLFSEEKIFESSRFINNESYVNHYAISNNVHPSFVYVFYAFNAPKTDKYAWGRAKKHNPENTIQKLKSKLENQMRGGNSFSEHIKKIRNVIYN